MWKETTAQERNRRIFEEELDGFLPARILDCHVHLWNAGVIPDGGTFSCGGHEISAYTREELDADLAAVFPGRETGAVCFGLPDPAYDRPRNNAYVAACCDGRRYFGFRLVEPGENPDLLRSEIKAHGFCGLKPYPDYVRGREVSQVEIQHMLPGPIMAVANELGLAVMLHIPRPQRLADPLNQAQICALCRQYPRARIILAHIGRAYYLKNVVGQLDTLKDLPNLYYDLAMLNHWEVLEHLFATVPADRILFGTDLPIALAPGKSVEINHQYTYVTPVPWKLSICATRGKLVFTSFLYEQLRAIKRAVERLALPRSFVEALFWENVRRLLANVATSMAPSV